MNLAIKKLIDQKRSEIVEFKRQIDELAREIELAQLKLEAYEEVGAAVDGNAVDLFPVMDKARRKRRPLSDVWRDVLLKVAATGSTGATLDEIVGYTEGVERKLVRSQMRYYHKQKFVRRSGERYIATETGIGVCRA